MSDSWNIDLTAVAATGNCTQLYPDWMSAGEDPFSAHDAGDEIRQPTAGRITSIKVASDGTNGGFIELWDMNGLLEGIDVSSAIVITNTQLTAAINAGRARRIWEAQVSSASGADAPGNTLMPFSKGLVARFSNSGPTGACTIILNIDGGARKVRSAGVS